MSKATFLFAHGAGADSQSDFMLQVSGLIQSDDIEVIRFDFPYMLKRKQTGKRSPPDKMPKLELAFIEQIKNLSTKRLFIGGKSMGGRVATLIADKLPVAGVICFGYPFHPPGKPEKLRTEHLTTIRTPTLIIQGTRDNFGKPEEVVNYRLSKSIHTHWIEDGDHSLTTLKRSILTTEAAWQLSAQYAQDFILAQAKLCKSSHND
ncbi:alpha/beta family hydrolase [Kangiella sp. HZ709]|uniref:alpha/beta family hydrolase n=1 Tax=Kangiella sp. HZ709 TaxID=2666328 RepID=UPI0012AF149B|nr:alpha/beta family hydrolase [Kangiella sp. HZ709]MRX28615.1 alpha/beta hydrolase [Kangiella sp. HZ709]